eukprot:354762-Chlamydomonas_euryale.AAC.5
MVWGVRHKPTQGSRVGVSRLARRPCIHEPCPSRNIRAVASFIEAKRLLLASGFSCILGDSFGALHTLRCALSRFGSARIDRAVSALFGSREHPRA